MADQATTITERDPAARLAAPNPNDELGRFAAAFNGLLDRLAAALHAQRQFMADASHELRTPVSVVRSAAQVTLARTDRPEADYRESLTIVAEQSARLARLVDAMFLLSRAEASGLPLMREPLYVDDVLDECVRAQRLLAGERGVMVTTAGDDRDDTLRRQHPAEADGRQPAGQRHPARETEWMRVDNRDVHAGARSRSPSSTTGTASRQISGTGSFSDSSGSTVAAPARVLVCRLPAGSPKRTVAR